MPQKSGNRKSVMLATRVMPRIRDIVVQMAYREGLNTSEWLRNLVIDELTRKDALPTVLREPNFKLEINEDERESVNG